MGKWVEDDKVIFPIDFFHRGKKTEIDESISRWEARRKAANKDSHEKALVKEEIEADIELEAWLNEIIEQEDAWKSLHDEKVAKRCLIESKNKRLNAELVVEDGRVKVSFLKGKRLLAELQLMKNTKIVNKEKFIDRVNEVAFFLYSNKLIDEDTYYNFDNISEFDEIELDKESFKKHIKKK